MNLQFLIAEEFRPEASGKVTALGVYPGNYIILLKPPQGIPDTAIPTLDRVAFLITVSELKGSHNYSGKIIDPNGNSVIDPNSNQIKEGVQPFGEGITIGEGMSHSFIFELKPFSIKTMGRYKFILYVDDAPHEFTFDIRKQL
ncbi:DUF6941 family protein [Sideroxydans lithotrophicus]|uniref:DUF6941 family protein n=1 Tax=Sideroxydans lithotrophicus TaxID=63745 RepID=UPI0012321C91|nr:hypothetical protein [Sideroxydans lithotrophicus]